MNKTVYKNFVKILSVAIATGSLIFNASAATSRTAIRGSVASRRPVASTRTGTTTNPVTTETPATTETTPEPVPETAPAPEPEPEVFENKTSQFDVVLSGVATNDGETTTSDLAEQIRKQRAAAEARDDMNIAISNLQKSSKSGKNTCDSGLRQCMQKNCGEDFTKCATDGDTLFGDKLNKCRRETTCTGEEFRLFTTEIKADRDMNVKLSSYNAVINCGNNYNSCIQKECGQTFEKCFGKTAADNAVKKCATIAKNCTEQDSGLAARFGNVIGGLRLDAEQDVTNDEKRLLELRDLMRKQCEHLGAMFDERSFDCVYTVNFFAGSNQTSPMASRKLYAGDTFICTQEWFGTNVTTFKENAYRETRAQTGASSAMLGSGLGTAAGLISSGAIGRALETQQAKKDLKSECTAQGGVLKNGECKLENRQTVNLQSSGKPQGMTQVNEYQQQALIKDSAKDGMKVGAKIDFPSSMEKDLKKELSEWEKACLALPLPTGAKSLEIDKTKTNTTTTYKCQIKECLNGKITQTKTECIGDLVDIEIEEEDITEDEFYLRNSEGGSETNVNSNLTGNSNLSMGGSLSIATSYNPDKYKGGCSKDKSDKLIAGGQGKSTLRLEGDSLTLCNGLQKNEWVALFTDNTYIKGISMCVDHTNLTKKYFNFNEEFIASDKTVPNEDQQKIQAAYDNQTPINSTKNPQCFCKKANSNTWVWLRKKATSMTNNCEKDCAIECRNSSNLQDIFN